MKATERLDAADQSIWLDHGRVELADFMPIGRANSSVIRLVEGRRGKVPMHQSGTSPRRSPIAR